MTLTSAEQFYDTIIRALKEGRYVDAEQEAIVEIHRTPLVPQGWVLLGEALLHQGFGAVARKVFNRAWLLDPEAGWAEAVEQTLRKTPAGPGRPDIDELLKVKKVTVTAGIIARDEERSIARCLSSLQGAADEILLIDCESKDRTVEIASEFPNVRIVRTTWENDFSALRNFGLRHMTTDWVVWVDADEHLHPDDIGSLREAAGVYDDLAIPPVLYIWQVNSLAEATLHEFSQTRMFPLRYGLKYHGRIHEQVGPREGSIFDLESYRKPVRIRLLHDGYEPDIIKSKAKIDRNLKLLEQMVQDEPENPGWWTYYARESLSAGLVNQALNGLAEAEKTASRQPRFGRLLDVYMLAAKIRMSREEWDLAEAACEKALRLSPDYPDAMFYSAAIKMKKGYALYRDAEKLLRKSKKSFERYRGTVSPDREIAHWKADVTLADIARSVGRFADAAQLYRQVAQRYPYVNRVRKPLQEMDEQLQKLYRLYPPSPPTLLPTK